MASSINASTSGSGGVITTADNSGVLNLQSSGTTVATIQSSGLSLPTGSTFNAANTFGFKNRIINGGMVIDQRNVGGSTSNAVNGYTVDRWAVYQSTTGKLIAQQNAGAVTPPVGFSNYLGVTSQSAYSIGSSDYYGIEQSIEGFNTADLNWGTANAKTVTLSFWVYSSLTGTFGGRFQNYASDYSYPFSYSVPAANTWTQINITVAGPTSGTWVGATNSIGIKIFFGLGVGATYSASAGSWQSGNYLSATGATSVVGTNNATFYLTGVQLELGSQATSFDFRSIGQELLLCQRYYEKSYNTDTVPGAAAQYNGMTLMRATSQAGGVSGGSIGFRVTKRANPTMVFYNGPTGASGTWNFNYSGNNTTASPNATIGTNQFYFDIGAISAYVASESYGHWTAAAEL